MLNNIICIVCRVTNILSTAPFNIGFVLFMFNKKGFLFLRSLL